MRTVIDIAPEQVARLDRLAAKAGTSRAALIREAVADLLDRERPQHRLEAFHGLWRDPAEDGLAYQERLRAEWPA